MPVVLTVVWLTGCGGSSGGDSGSDGSSSSSAQAVITVFKTGQAKSFDTNGNEVTDGSVKDDGYYRKGLNHNYTRDDVSGIVTDYVTGLMWQDDANVSNVIKPWLSVENYTTCENNHSSPACSDTAGDTAATYCERLILGGHNDWRLPNGEELEGIVNYKNYAPSIDTTFFQNIASNYYWTNETYIVLAQYAWYVRFGLGTMDIYRKNNSCYIRCVRSGSR